MNKQEFADALRRALDGYPTDEVERSVAFYIEMIDDCMENGMTEADAVASVGSVEEVARKIREEMPLSALVKDRVQTSYQKNKQKTGGSAVPWIILAVVLSPLWIPLLIAAVCVLFGLIAAVFGVVIGFFGAVIGMIGGAIACVVMLILSGDALGTPGVLLCGLGGILMCLGIAILLFWAALGLGSAAVCGIRALYRAVKRGLSRKS